MCDVCYLFTLQFLFPLGQVLSATKDTIQGTVGKIWNTASNTFVSWWGNTAAGSVDSDEDEQEVKNTS